MYYYIYKITLTKGSLANHYYIGQHATNDLEDNYKGSGVYVKKYYKKYPNDYIKEILCYCNTKEELNQKEHELVGDLWETDDMCLNLRAGGMQPGMSEEQKKKISIAMTGDKNPMYGVHNCGKDATNYGKQMSEEQKKKISIAMTGTKHPGAKSITIQNILTNEILTFGCIKDCAEYLQVDTHGTFRIKFLKGLPTPKHPILQNYTII